MRRWDDLVAAVDSLRYQTTPLEEIIVVVDHNEELLQRAQSELAGVVVVANGAGPGLSNARNTGAERARGQVVLFLDDDAVAEADCVEALCRPLALPDVLGVGGNPVPLWAGRIPRWLPEEFYWTVGCSYRGLPTDVAPVRNLIGCCMAVRRKVFETVGGFVPGVGRDLSTASGCEETELCIRASQRWQRGVWLYDPEAVVQHRVPESRATWRYFVQRCYAEGKSKALVAQLVGESDALASERTYTFRTLPLGVLTGILDTARGDYWGLARSAAIVAGLLTTGLGYARGAYLTSSPVSPSGPSKPGVTSRST